MADRPREQPRLSYGLLAEVAETRLGEAKALLAASYWVGAVYLGGFAVECYLKAAICRTHEYEDLPKECRTHNLVLLLTASGLEETLNKSGFEDILESFKKVVSYWNVQGDEHIRYAAPSTSKIKRETARQFLRFVDDAKIGVVPWLRRMMS